MTFPILLAVALLVNSGCAQFSLPPSPCPEMYSYEHADELNGLISILTPPRYAEAEVEATFSSTVAVAQDDRFEMSVRGGNDAILEAKDSAKLGRRHVLLFTVKFPRHKPVPTLLKVTVNGRVFCGGDEVPENSRSETILNAVLSTDLETPQSNGQDFDYVTDQKPLNTPVCWPEFEPLPGVGCYKEVKERMNWKEAQSNCEQLGAKLAVPKTQQEVEFFHLIAARPDGQSPWLGIFKSDGEWRTVQGTIIPGNSSLWEPGEPSGNGNCAAVWERGGLDDRGCGAWVRSICQQP